MTAEPKRETNIQSEIMLALSDADCIIWRNNVGSVKTENRFIRYGVGGPGGSDLIGITPGGRFLAVEVKTKTGRVSPNQVLFIDAVNRCGGVAGVCRSAGDALELIKNK